MLDWLFWLDPFSSQPSEMEPSTSFDPKAASQVVLIGGNIDALQLKLVLTVKPEFNHVSQTMDTSYLAFKRIQVQSYAGT